MLGPSTLAAHARLDEMTNDPELDDAATPAELETMAAQDYSTLPLGFPTC